MPAPQPRATAALTRLVGGVRVAVLALLVALAVWSGVLALQHAASAPARSAAAGDVPARWVPPQERSVAGQSLDSCGELGHGDPSDPGGLTALVRTPAGAVRAVSFERGWEVFQGHRPGTLVAVCRG